MAKERMVGNLPKVAKRIEDVLSIEYNEENQQITSARALWEWLEVETPFTMWFNRKVEEYGFEEGKDFVEVLLNKNVKQRGGHNAKDYAIKLGMAKELSMAEKTEKGKTTRKYFLKCEEKAKETMPALPQTFAEALRMLADKVDENKALTSKLIITEDELKRYQDRFEGVLTRGEWAKKLKQEGLDVNERRTKNSKKPSITEILESMGITEWIDNTTEVAKQEYVDRGWFVNVQKRGTNGFPSVTTYITVKGQKELTQKVHVWIVKQIDRKLKEVYGNGYSKEIIDVMANAELLKMIQA